MRFNIANLVAFQLGWIASILAAAAGAPWAGPVIMGAWIAVHLSVVPLRAAELQLVLAAAALGWVADSALTAAGLLEFPVAARLGWLSPLWMVFLWAGFAATLRHALGWLRPHPGWAAALGAVGGPAAYLGGEALGAIALPGGEVAIAAVALEYALALPLLYMLLGRLERRAEEARISREMVTS